MTNKVNESKEEFSRALNQDAEIFSSRIDNLLHEPIEGKQEFNGVLDGSDVEREEFNGVIEDWLLGKEEFDGVLDGSKLEKEEFRNIIDNYSEKVSGVEEITERSQGNSNDFNGIDEIPDDQVFDGDLDLSECPIGPGISEERISKDKELFD